MSALAFIFSLIPFYLIGCIPCGYLVARRSGVNITSEGSGNVGATNVARTVGKRAGLYTLVLDIAKGFVSVTLAMALVQNNDYPAWAGLCTVAGHCFSIPGKLKGGKGVATGLGVYLALTPHGALIGMVVFGLIFAWTKIASISSLAAALVIPLGAIFMGASTGETTAMLLMSLLVIYRHRNNLNNLINGTEKKFSTKPQPSEGSPA